MPERNLTKEAKTRLRRIEGQVRGIQSMLDRLDEDSSSVEQRARDLLASGATQLDVAQELGVPRKRIAEIAKENAVAIEPCDSLLTQILAVRAAVEQVGLLIMELHLEECVFCDEKMDAERLGNLRETLRSWSRLSSKLR